MHKINELFIWTFSFEGFLNFLYCIFPALLFLVSDYANPGAAGNPLFEFVWDLFHLRILLSIASSW